MFRRLIVILVAALASLLPASESVSATAVIVDGAYTYDVPIEQRADASARALDLDSALARRAWEGVAGTTTSAAARYTYDARTSTRVDNCAIGVACAATNQLSNALEVSALLSVEGHGASTAPSVAFVATNRLATSADDAVFWSGIGRGGDATAASWAAKNGGVTLESTLAQRGIQLPAWDAANPSVVAAWRNASADFASGASGNVRVLQGVDVRVGSVWAEVEYPALISNPNVTSITAINPITGGQVVLWTAP